MTLTARAVRVEDFAVDILQTLVRVVGQLHGDQVVLARAARAAGIGVAFQTCAGRSLELGALRVDTDFPVRVAVFFQNGLDGVVGKGTGRRMHQLGSVFDFEGNGRTQVGAFDAFSVIFRVPQVTDIASRGRRHIETVFPDRARDTRTSAL